MTNKIAEQHSALASKLDGIATNVTDWDAPTPVKEWRARDILEHLITWLPGMLGAAGVALPTVEVGDDVLAAWREHTANVQALVDDDEQLERTIDVGSGEQTLGAVLEQYYLPDLFMHRWDLAKASGQDPDLEPEMVRGTVTDMTPMAETLKESGEFGTPVVLDESHSDEERMVALIGRDPHWAP
ncbi:maleylpyruvate isomerase N-terminal domain-containing protein [Tessaracoccus massiliensis]|uniref:maleylpyruvate isomerase N-terminal domain-containing protein n=1 Tax=Tessaracoccus massiliensis TaxID=1522311 RepID=UPI00058B73C5|nr:maleylpyruvate isomerase N-terminal domain-containing protein [Tessaracoccus massiliensis]